MHYIMMSTIDNRYRADRTETYGIDDVYCGAHVYVQLHPFVCRVCLHAAQANEIYGVNKLNGTVGLLAVDGIH